MRTATRSIGPLRSASSHPPPVFLRPVTETRTLCRSSSVRCPCFRVVAHGPQPPSTPLSIEYPCPKGAPHHFYKTLLDHHCRHVGTYRFFDDLVRKTCPIGLPYSHGVIQTLVLFPPFGAVTVAVSDKVCGACVPVSTGVGVPDPGAGQGASVTTATTVSLTRSGTVV